MWKTLKINHSNLWEFAIKMSDPLLNNLKSLFTRQTLLNNVIQGQSQNSANNTVRQQLCQRTMLSPLHSILIPFSLLCTILPVVQSPWEPLPATSWFFSYHLHLKSPLWISLPGAWLYFFWLYSHSEFSLSNFTVIYNYH